jgi:hypothetical protein
MGLALLNQTTDFRAFILTFAYVLSIQHSVVLVLFVLQAAGTVSQPRYVLRYLEQINSSMLCSKELNLHVVFKGTVAKSFQRRYENPSMPAHKQSGNWRHLQAMCTAARALHACRVFHLNLQKYRNPQSPKKGRGRLGGPCKMECRGLGHSTKLSTAGHFLEAILSLQRSADYFRRMQQGCNQLQKSNVTAHNKEPPGAVRM